MVHFLGTILLEVLLLVVAVEYSIKLFLPRRLLTVSWNG